MPRAPSGPAAGEAGVSRQRLRRRGRRRAPARQRRREQAARAGARLRVRPGGERRACTLRGSGFGLLNGPLQAQRY